ncbi:hypothetical protein EON68_00525 [archaeon]|nr:MAG: hypothetical protein EON68_00525 [archaeon]
MSDGMHTLATASCTVCVCVRRVPDTERILFCNWDLDMESPRPRGFLAAGGRASGSMTTTLALKDKTQCSAVQCA